MKIWQDGEWVDLDLNAKYNLAGYNYTLRDLGDGFAMFDGAVNVLDYVMEDYMVLANYIQSFPVDEQSGLPTVTAENSPYGSVYGEGRIKLLKGFTDVPAGEYFSEAVNWAAAQGIVNGMGDGTFLPYRAVTRAEIVTMLWRANGSKIVEVENPFTDVSEGDYFYNAVLWAVKNGIASGITASRFAPNGVATRAEAITFLWRAEGKLTAATASGFVDVAAGTWYEAAINWAVEEKIAFGIEENIFGVNDVCSRCQMATFLFRAK